MQLSETNKAELRTFLVQVYGPRASNWPMTSRMVNLTFRLLEKSDGCSDLLALASRVSSPDQSATQWLSMSQVSAVLHKLAKGKHYYATNVKKAADDLKAGFYREAQVL